MTTNIDNIIVQYSMIDLFCADTRSLLPFQMGIGVTIQYSRSPHCSLFTMEFLSYNFMQYMSSAILFSERRVRTKSTRATVRIEIEPLIK